MRNRKSQRNRKTPSRYRNRIAVWLDAPKRNRIAVRLDLPKRGRRAKWRAGSHYEPLAKESLASTVYKQKDAGA